MAEDLGVSVLKLTTDASSLNAGIDQAHSSALGLGATFGLVTAGINQGIELVEKAFEALNKVFDFTIGAAADYADHVRDLSIQTGLATESISGLSLQAKLNGTSIETMRVGFRTLSNVLTDAMNGSDEARRKFTALGITTDELKATNGDLDKVYRLVLDRMSQFPESAQKNALMNDLFGRSALELKETMDQGVRGYDNTIAMAEKYNLLVTKAGGEAADRFNDSLIILSAAIKGIGISIGKDFLPKAMELTTWITRNIDSIKTGVDVLIGSIELLVHPTQKVFELMQKWGLAEKQHTDDLLAATPIYDTHARSIYQVGDSLQVLIDKQEKAAAIEKKYAEVQADLYREAVVRAGKFVDAWLEGFEKTSAEADKHTDAVQRSAVAASELAETAVDAAAVISSAMVKAHDAWDAANEKTMISNAKLFNELHELDDTEYNDWMAAMTKRVKLEEDMAKRSLADYQRMGDEFARTFERMTEAATYAFAGMIVHAKFSMDQLESIAQDTAQSMLASFLKGLISPLTNELTKLGTQLGDIISKSLGIGGGIGGGAVGAATQGAGGIGGGAGGLFGLSTVATLGIGAGVAAAVALASHFIGKGRRTADDFVTQFQDPFGDVLAGIVKTGTVSDLDQAWATFNQTSDKFASEGSTQAKVVSQAHTDLDPLVAQIRRDLVSQGRDGSTVINNYTQPGQDANQIAQELYRMLSTDAALRSQFNALWGTA